MEEITSKQPAMCNTLKQDDIIELSIEKLVNSGSAIARYEGKTVFIDNAVPSDVVKVRVLKVNKNFIRAKIVEITSPSKYRVKPFCPLFNACGGCNLQNVEYNFLICQKEHILKEIFSGPHPFLEGVEFKPFIKSDVLKEYRAKVQSAVSETKVSKRLLIGHYKENTHDVVNIKHCPIHPAVIDEITAYIRENWKLGAYVEKKNKGLLKHLLMRISTTSGKILLTFVLNKDFEYFDTVKPGLSAFIDEITAKFSDISGVAVNFNPKPTNKILGEITKTLWGDGFIYQKLYANNGIEFTYKVSTESFFQINPSSASKLFSCVKSLVKPDSTILDAYGGVAAIGIYLSPDMKKITLVEESKSACSDAKANFKLNNVKNYEVFEGDAKKVFKDFMKAKKSFDYVILDPPRKGSDKEALSVISKLAKRGIVYISCNPSTQFRDAKILFEAGFKLKSIQGVDMFPFTHHIESVALFEK